MTALEARLRLLRLTGSHEDVVAMKTMQLAHAERQLERYGPRGNNELSTEGYVGLLVSIMALRSETR